MLNIYGLIFWLIIDEFDFVVYFLKNSHHSNLSNKRAKVQKFLLYITLKENVLYTFPLMEKCTKDQADMNAARSVRPLTAAAKMNWTLTRFCTPL